MTTTPAVDLVSLLHRYQSLRGDADDDLKSSVWNITKARRGRSYQAGGGFGGVEFSSDDVREELRAQALLEWRARGDVDEDIDEPRLLDEGSLGDDGVDGGAKRESAHGEFVLHFDGMKSLREAKQRSGSDAAGGAQATQESEGLRRRRGGNRDANEDDRASKWTSEREDVVDEEERRLRNADPLNLFGVPPPALRVAQAKSRSAVAYYVEVANLAREIMKITARDADGGAD